jgi:hypothetical protein
MLTSAWLGFLLPRRHVCTGAAVFFDRYQAALLDRDAAQLATMYPIPSLILFPGSSIPVSDQAQTEQFFTSSSDQYKGVTEVDHKLRIIADPGVGEDELQGRLAEVVRSCHSGASTVASRWTMPEVMVLIVTTPTPASAACGRKWRAAPW